MDFLHPSLVAEFFVVEQAIQNTWQKNEAQNGKKHQINGDILIQLMDQISNSSNCQHQDGDAQKNHRKRKGKSKNDATEPIDFFMVSPQVTKIVF